jgi:hypothetical protein
VEGKRKDVKLGGERGNKANDGGIFVKGAKEGEL